MTTKTSAMDFLQVHTSYKTAKARYEEKVESLFCWKAFASYPMDRGYYTNCSSSAAAAWYLRRCRLCNLHFSLSLSFYLLSPALFYSLSFSLLLSLFLSFTLSLCYALSFSLSLLLTHSLFLFLSLFLFYTHSVSFFLSLSVTLSLSLILSLFYSLTHSFSFFLSLSLCYSFPLSFTPTLAYAPPPSTLSSVWTSESINHSGNMHRWRPSALEIFSLSLSLYFLESSFSVAHSLSHTHNHTHTG